MCSRRRGPGGNWGPSAYDALRSSCGFQTRCGSAKNSVRNSVFARYSDSPEVIVPSIRTVIWSPPGTPSTNRETGSSRPSLPSSTSCRIRVVVKVLVMLPMRCCSCADIGVVVEVEAAPTTRNSRTRRWRSSPGPARRRAVASGRDICGAAADRGCRPCSDGIRAPARLRRERARVRNRRSATFAIPGRCSFDARRATWT